MLRDFLARHDADILDELAADFAKAFLASGEYQGKGAFPMSPSTPAVRGWCAAGLGAGARHL